MLFVAEHRMRNQLVNKSIEREKIKCSLSVARGVLQRWTLIEPLIKSLGDKCFFKIFISFLSKGRCKFNLKIRSIFGFFLWIFQIIKHHLLFSWQKASLHVSAWIDWLTLNISWGLYVYIIREIIWLFSIQIYQK
jgi:hypothetical protein